MNTFTSKLCSFTSSIHHDLWHIVTFVWANFRAESLDRLQKFETIVDAGFSNYWMVLTRFKYFHISFSFPKTVFFRKKRGGIMIYIVLHNSLTYEHTEVLSIILVKWFWESLFTLKKCFVWRFSTQRAILTKYWHTLLMLDFNFQSPLGDSCQSCMEKIPKSYKPCSFRHWRYWP